MKDSSPIVQEIWPFENVPISANVPPRAKNPKSVVSPHTHTIKPQGVIIISIT